MEMKEWVSEFSQLGSLMTLSSIPVPELLSFLKSSS